MGMMRNLGLIMGTGLLSSLGCDGLPGLGCTELYAYGLNVTVKDDTTNQPICDAVVKAVDGSHSEQLESISIGTGDCAYTGAGERAGNYTLTAMKSGYLDTTQGGNLVTADACHVHGIAVTLRLRH